MKKFMCAQIISLSILLFFSNSNINAFSYSNELKPNINTVEFNENSEDIFSNNNINPKARGISQSNNYESKIAIFAIILAFGAFTFFTLKKKNYEHI